MGLRKAVLCPGRKWWSPGGGSRGWLLLHAAACFAEGSKIFCWFIFAEILNDRSLKSQNAAAQKEAFL